jgi:flagellar biosynthesis GTPase FlhF
MAEKISDLEKAILILKKKDFNRTLWNICEKFKTFDSKNIKVLKLDEDYKKIPAKIIDDKTKRSKRILYKKTVYDFILSDDRISAAPRHISDPETYYGKIEIYINNKIVFACAYGREIFNDGFSNNDDYIKSDYINMMEDIIGPDDHMSLKYDYDFVVDPIIKLGPWIDELSELLIEDNKAKVEQGIENIRKQKEEKETKIKANIDLGEYTNFIEEKEKEEKQLEKKEKEEEERLKEEQEEERLKEEQEFEKLIKDQEDLIELEMEVKDLKKTEEKNQKKINDLEDNLSTSIERNDKLQIDHNTLILEHKNMNKEFEDQENSHSLTNKKHKEKIDILEGSKRVYKILFWFLLLILITLLFSY